MKIQPVLTHAKTQSSVVILVVVLRIAEQTQEWIMFVNKIVAFAVS